MPSAAASPTVEVAAAKPRRALPKKFIVIALAGGAGVYFWKKRAAAAAEAEDGAPAAASPAERSKTPPTYLPLDAFTVNLADKDAERFAQVGVTFELEDAHASEEVKNYMPSIRNAILLILTHKTSAELLGREGKERLAREIARESTRAMGFAVAEEVEAPPAAASAAASAAPMAGDDEEATAAPRKTGKAASKKPGDEHGTTPIRRVHFANFIIQ